MTDIDGTPELNEDSLALIRVMSMFQNSVQNMGTEDDSNSYFSVSDFQRLSDLELSNLYRQSKLIKKIINKYPLEAVSCGYIVKDLSGKVLSTNDDILLQAFYDASVSGRLYGKCFLVLDFDKTESIQPMKKGDNLSGYRLMFDLIKDGDFYIENQTVKHHQDKVFLFLGSKTYLKNIGIDDQQYADSILQDSVISFRNYTTSLEISRKILANLSYLLIGIDNLGTSLRTDRGRQDVLERLMSLKTSRNVNRAIPYDKQKEILSFISQNVSGINDIIANLKEVFIADSDYPPSVLFEEDSRQSMGSGVQNQLIARFLWAKRSRSWVVNSWLKQYKLFYGRYFQTQNFEIEIPFNVELTVLEQSELEKLGAERVQLLIESNVITPMEARTGYSGASYTLNIMLDDNTFAKYLKETISKNNETIKQNPNENTPTTNEDSLLIPDDDLWANLSTVTVEDLERVMEDAVSS